MDIWVYQLHKVEGTQQRLGPNSKFYLCCVNL